MKKRVLPIILAAAVLLSMGCFAAAEGAAAVKWDIDSKGVMTVSADGRMPDYVKNPAPWEKRRSEIKEIIVTEGVTHIGENAFQYCSKVKTVSLPSTLESLGYGSFYKCESLKEIVIPDGVTEIGGKSFDHCSKLVKAVIPEGVEEIPDECFNCCAALEEIYLPSTVESIGGSAFNSCKLLKTVYYGGDSDEWSEIDIGPYNRYLSAASVDCGQKAPVSEKKNEAPADKTEAASDNNSEYVEVKITKDNWNKYFEITETPEMVTGLSSHGYDFNLVYRVQLKSAYVNELSPDWNGHVNFNFEYDECSGKFKTTFAGLSYAAPDKFDLVKKCHETVEIEVAADMKADETNIIAFTLMPCKKEIDTVQGEVCRNFTVNEVGGKIFISRDAAEESGDELSFDVEILDAKHALITLKNIDCSKKLPVGGKDSVENAPDYYWSVDFYKGNDIVLGAAIGYWFHGNSGGEVTIDKMDVHGKLDRYRSAAVNVTMSHTDDEVFLSLTMSPANDIDLREMDHFLYYITGSLQEHESQLLTK